ncbi:HD domain-containing protein [Ponticoccus sp. SC2-23]|uniref:HD domain-containing protein n=1 Tax=Alexandriicola marinus TaxID=2081710 RepID=UPI000FD9493C|nr:HD domain-containing protein [Alexandriicola marinus]MBM1219211.1 HD domain-containing protein [Ponticoccus sp. SC6-9]MBM1223717.1 HD domain-containing protein [Ponticoccus sp. SC6-15]MBM1229024.1 HD domain-containing protein [Ponticoccus sp. SC6-38]MBM1232683.1 HD domain-containing protein [Ponticoccus sp. SC6-45]MBM1237367.1 HD domain-containing protein [Ponticoccus sp. SC6-49]MBM1241694.1 HD domain-containing protein [Ponticoccus sp. SC2-64]MBM1246207.1 HD domain-containing protein [Po
MTKIADTARYDPVWRAAEPYMRARRNDVHIPLSFAWCQRLLDLHPEADRDVCSLAILLHDIGWYSIDMDRIIEEGFRSDNPLQSDVRYLHEAEGVRLGTEVLRATGWSEEIIAQVCEIIDGHDTRPDPHHLNDRIVRDADKLWRFEVTGIAVACDWFAVTPHGYADMLEAQKDILETAPGREMAARELAATRAKLMLHVL